MNPTERLHIWQVHLTNATASLDSVRQRFSGLGEAEISRLRANWKAMVKTAQENVKFYEQRA